MFATGVRRSTRLGQHLVRCCTPSLELDKLYSALSTSAQILAETLDKAARAQGV
ncbi:hypothetical protein HBO07_27170 [Pseudomonas proteolytica]|uniref:hypothetical protein n=1 Tax=Pseudomonas proteolytica TaxID=219574 RepID=UPI001473FF37|nr:hypothetical protein [Pseudomonas proteolytica]NMZ14944.1 hypothetical protein [Pseudomonas proteolytica]